MSLNLRWGLIIGAIVCTLSLSVRAAYLGTPTYIIPCANCLSGTADVTTTTSTSLIAAPGASLFIYVTHISCFNSSVTNTTVVLQNGSAGTTIWKGIAYAGSGFVADFSTPLGGSVNMTANTALFFAAGTGVTTLTCSAVGYKSS
jgi:hypothetical protein